MDKQDPIESKFRSTFSGSEREPSPGVWENLSKMLHADVHPVGFWTRLVNLSFFAGLHPAFYAGFGGLVLTITMTVFWLVPSRHYELRGHAYAGDTRLCRGTAILFQVNDETMPWDSVKHYRSAIIDNYGHYQFSRVNAGKYLLRAAPEEFSQTDSRFLPSWHDRHEKSDSCDLLIIKDKDVTADVHLIAKPPEGK